MYGVDGLVVLVIIQIIPRCWFSVPELNLSYPMLWMAGSLVTKYGFLVYHKAINMYVFLFVSFLFSYIVKGCHVLILI